MAPPGVAVDAWPGVFDIAEQWYLKPDAGRVFASPADETPSPPCDAQPDEFDVAVAVDRIERATTLQVRRLMSRWAGLRVFTADRAPVIGFDGQTDGLLWLAGLGGAGIQSAHGAALALAGLVDTGELPALLRDFGLTPQALSPARLC